MFGLIHSSFLPIYSNISSESKFNYKHLTLNNVTVSFCMNKKRKTMKQREGTRSRGEMNTLFSNRIKMHYITISKFNLFSYSYFLNHYFIY